MHIIFPQHCPICGKLSVPYCNNCIDNSVDTFLPPLCASCGSLYNNNCCNAPIACYSIAAHSGAMRQLLLALKYKNYRSIGTALGEKIAHILPITPADYIIPMPLHLDSKRNFNQTELISNGISHCLKIPVKNNLLKWNRNIVNQTRKNAIQRLALPLNSFKCEDEIYKKKVILVDDVYTTGGTVKAAVYALQKAGADVVSVYTVTRRIKHKEDVDSWPNDDESYYSI